MKLIREKYEKIGKLYNQYKTTFEVYTSAIHEVEVANIDNVQFCWHEQYDYIGVSDTRLVKQKLSYEERFKPLFAIKNYEIINKTRHLETLPNKDEVLRVAQEWCDKWKKLEEEMQHEKN